MMSVFVTSLVTMALVSAEPAEPAADLAAAPATSADAPPAEPLYGYDKGAFVRSPGGDFFLKANGRVQARYTLDASDMEGGYAVDGTAFSLPRARAKLSGHAFDPRLGFELQLDVGKGFLSLKDAFLEYDILPDLALAAGQLKRPFSLQQMTSSSKLALVDRALTDDYFDAGRDVGLTLAGGSEKDGLSYAVGVFNGSGPYKRFFGLFDAPPGSDEEDAGLPLLRTPMAAGRVAWSFGDVKMYDELDRDGGPLRAAVGASGYVRSDPYEGEHGRSTLSVDTMLKAYGLAATGALYASLAGGHTGAAAEAVGGHVQASYTLLDRLVPVVQAGAVIPLHDAERPLYEARAGLSVLFKGHDAKWTTDVGTVTDGIAPDVQVRTQLQLAL